MCAYMLLCRAGGGYLRVLFCICFVSAWLANAAFFSFQQPFPWAGNGFFSCWVGVVVAFQLLLKEAKDLSEGVSRTAKVDPALLQDKGNREVDMGPAAPEGTSATREEAYRMA